MKNCCFVLFCLLIVFVVVFYVVTKLINRNLYFINDSMINYRISGMKYQYVCLNMFIYRRFSDFSSASTKRWWWKISSEPLRRNLWTCFLSSFGSRTLISVHDLSIACSRTIDSKGMEWMGVLHFEVCRSPTGFSTQYENLLNRALIREGERGRKGGRNN